MNDRPNIVWRLLRGFAMFWWDFLVGDTPELFIAALVIIAAIAWLSESLHANAAAVIVLPVLAIAALTLSVKRASDAAKRK